MSPAAEAVAKERVRRMQIDMVLAEVAAAIALPTDGAFDPSLADDVLEEPSVVYRSCSADSVDEGEQMDGSLLALQVRAHAHVAPRLPCQILLAAGTHLLT